jgi:hypothetical protein
MSDETPMSRWSGWWKPAPSQPWRWVCDGPDYGGVWAELVAALDGNRAAPRVVLPAGTDPNARLP